MTSFYSISETSTGREKKGLEADLPNYPSPRYPYFNVINSGMKDQNGGSTLTKPLDTYS